MNKLIADIIETPLGKMLAVADDDFLYELSFYQETEKNLSKQTQYLSNSITIILKK